VIEDYISREAIGADPNNPKQRRGHHIARELRRVVLPLWARRPVADICRARPAWQPRLVAHRLDAWPVRRCG